MQTNRVTEIIPTIENKSNLFNVYKNNRKNWIFLFGCCCCLVFWMNTRDILNAWQKKNSRWWWWPTATTTFRRAKTEKTEQQKKCAHTQRHGNKCRETANEWKKKLCRNSLKLFIRAYEEETKRERQRERESRSEWENMQKKIILKQTNREENE